MLADGASYASVTAVVGCPPAYIARWKQRFETVLEIMEGTANYVARRSLGQGPGATATRLRAERRPEGVRWRFYESGTALGFLLDRCDPRWKARSDEEPDLTMVELLTTALASRCVELRVFSDDEIRASGPGRRATSPT